LAEHHFQLVYRGNWKSHHENANDTIHPGFVHESSVATARARTAADTDFDDGQTREMMDANGFTRREWENIELIAFPGGHSYMGGIYRSGLMARRTNDPVQDRCYAAMVAHHGSERADAILNMDRFNNLIYPNLNINAQFHQLRIVQPLSPDRTMVTSHCFRLDGAPEEIFHRAVRFLTNLGSPASMIYSDDAALFERCSTGLHNSDHPWIDIGRGLGLERAVEGNGLAAPASEAPIRGQFNAWLDYLSAEDR
jgi:phenylpropionate dioxygenase-like ring-hydroxylating dioxygenase large terminal subunit